MERTEKNPSNDETQGPDTTEPPQNRESREEKPSPMNLLTNPEGTVAAIADVEGPAWAYADQHGQEYTVASALEQLASLQSGQAEDNGHDVAATIYGDGGTNRYQVTRNGEVFFSGFHGLSTSTRKAEQRGFRIFH